MAKKILVLLGSPRKKGNSAILAGEIARGAKAGGKGEGRNRLPAGKEHRPLQGLHGLP